MRTETTETKTGIRAASVAERVGIAIAMLSSVVMGFVFSALLFSDYLEVGTVVRYQPAAPVVYKDAGVRVNPNVILVKRSTTTKSDVFEQAVREGVSKYTAGKSSVDAQLQNQQVATGYERPAASTDKTPTTPTPTKKFAVSTMRHVLPSGAVVEKRADGTQRTSVLDQWYEVALNQPADTAMLTRTLQQTVKEIEVAQPQFVYTASIAPNDTYYPSYGSWGQSFEDLWGLKPRTTNVEYAWDEGTGDPGITIAVSDTGVDITHPDIDASIWTNADEIAGNKIDDDGNGFIDDVHGWDFAGGGTGDNTPTDLLGHGTHVAGTIAAEFNNATGIAGICPQCRIMPVRGLGDEGYGETSWLVAGITYAAVNGADVINMSWGGPVSGGSEDTLLLEALHEARTTYGVTLVAAAGNDSRDANTFTPASSPDVITVAATDMNDNRAWFSNYGSPVDIAAPGVDVLSLRAVNTDLYGNNMNVVGNQYLRASGTSMAAPHVAGIAGLVLSKNPALTPAEVQQVLQSTADDLNADAYPGWDAYFGNGRVNAQAAVAVAGNAPLRGQLNVTSNENGNVVGEDIPIAGTAYGPNFASYKLEVGAGVIPTTWLPISTSTVPVPTRSTLGTLNTENFFGTYTLRLTIQGTDGRKLSDASQVQIVRKSGWPVQTVANDNVQYGLLRSQTIRGSDNAIIGILHTGFTPYVGATGYMTIVQPNGQTLPGWPKNVGSITTPSVIDLDRNGTQEIIYMNGEYELRAKRMDGTDYTSSPLATVLQPQAADVFISDYLTLADIDATYPGNEILIMVAEWGGSGANKQKVYAWHANGSTVPGWPVEQNLTNVYDHVLVSPAVGDVDGNGDLEVVWQNASMELVVYNHDGSAMAGFAPPLLDTLTVRSPVLADIDNDGRAEILTSNLGIINIYDETGKPQLPCLPELAPGSVITLDSIIPADLDQDGAVELVLVGYDTQRYSYVVTAVRRNGQTMPGQWPRDLEFAIDATVKDINGDGFLDIIVGNKAYTRDGSNLENWAMSIPAYSTQLIEDFDGDGKYELFYKDEKSMYMWDLPYTVNTTPVTWESPYSNAAHASSTTCPTCKETATAYDSLCARCGSGTTCEQADCGQCYSGSCAFAQCTCRRPVAAFTDWPKLWQAQFSTMPTQADLTGDGQKELVLYNTNDWSHKQVDAFTLDGGLVPGWPLLLQKNTDDIMQTDSYALGNFSAADINNDGREEIVTTYERTLWSAEYSSLTSQYGIIAYGSDGKALPGFPVETGLAPSIVLRDVLGGAEHLGMELIAVTRDSARPLRVLNANGTPAIAGNGPYAGAMATSNTLVEDIDYDGQVEIVATVGTVYGENIRMTIWNLDGSIQTSWPVIGNNEYRFITAADIDPSFAGLEILFGTDASRQAPISVFHHNGTAVSGWPFLPEDLVIIDYLPNSRQITVGDVTGDGVPEIIAAVYDATSQRLYVLNRNGSPLARYGFMYGGARYGYDQFHLVDVDGDNVAEIISPDGSEINAWNSDGTIATGFPLRTWGDEGIVGIRGATNHDAYPAFGDWNKDGKLDIVFVGGGKVRALDLGVPWHPEASPWPEGYGGPTRRSFAGKYLSCADGTFSGVCNSSKRYCQETTLLPQQCNRCGLTCPSGYSCQSGKCCQKISGTLKCVSPIVPTTGTQ